MKTLDKNTRLLLILATVPVLLLVPFIAMQFSTTVNWSLFDFIIMGVLLFLAGGMIEVVLRRVRSRDNRLVLLAIIVLLFLLVWAELAVGIFGSPFAGS